MTDIVLRDIDPVLAERIRRVAEARNWAPNEALMHLLEHGLFACETELAARFSDTDADALKAAISALEGVPSDPGYSLIGRAPRPVDEGDWGHQGGSQVDADLQKLIDQVPAGKNQAG